ncbi:MAG: aldehyde dehydrogenase family protein [Verrucomicrobiota bacterium]
MQPILLNGSWTAPNEPLGAFQASNPATGETLTAHSFPVSSWNDLEALLEAGAEAARAMADLPPEAYAEFLESYADAIEARTDLLVEWAHLETGLPDSPRLRKGELPRTTNQLRQAAAAARERTWRQATIDTASGIRSIHNPLGGPVLVFGPNNFPFAYNGIAGGDFAAALAAGNPVIAKAHPAHPYTTTLLAEAALEALEGSRLPKAAVQLFYNTEPELGIELVSAPQTAALAFTGSRPGGLALKEAADKAGKPVYLEMSSVNPIFLLPGALDERLEAIVEDVHGSCTLGGGQFCTKPGLLIVQEGASATAFLDALQAKFEATAPTPLLTEQIPTSMGETVTRFQDAGAELLVGGTAPEGEGFRFHPTLLKVDGEAFLADPDSLSSEAFGPTSLVIVAKDLAEMKAIAAQMEGNLTGSLYTATDDADEAAYAALAPIVRQKVGRLLNDKVPTGVAVVPSMNHGGPFPATGHPGFTAVGFPAALIRFTALHCYDNVRPARLPLELQDPNPTGSMLRLIDGEWTTADIPPVLEK